MMNARFFLFLLFFLPTYVSAELNRHKAEGISFELVSDVEAFVPGDSFTVGLNIDLEEGFHTYWKNPGIVGLPVMLEWTLPEGMTAGPIQWPTPERLKMAIHPAHGFKRDVTLLVEMTSSKKLSEVVVNLTCQVRWMACSRTCHPGETQLALSVPVGTETLVNEEKVAVFAAARADLPEEVEGLTLEGTLLPQVGLVLLSAGGEALTSDLEDCYFYSFNGLVSSNRSQTVRRSIQGELLIAMELSEYASDESKELLNGVLSVVDSHTGDRKNLWVSMPLAHLRISSLEKGEFSEKAKFVEKAEGCCCEE